MAASCLSSANCPHVRLLAYALAPSPATQPSASPLLLPTSALPFYGGQFKMSRGSLSLSLSSLPLEAVRHAVGGDLRQELDSSGSWRLQGNNARTAVSEVFVADLTSRNGGSGNSATLHLGFGCCVRGSLRWFSFVERHWSVQVVPLPSFPASRTQTDTNT